MAIRFTPCPACARHVREGDATCPFCGATSRAPAELPRALSTRLSRAAFLALGAAGALAATDCSSSSSSPVPAYGLPPLTEAGFPQPLYGAVVVLPDAGSGNGGIVPLPDAGSEDAAPEQDAAPEEDAAPEKDGGFAQPLYGAIAVPYGLPPGGGKR
ncbi:MAG TPA: hypothetical protein VK762_12580 [Polyangiaceae bacterium]|nr:hypothetical protein [Polyangiaceae bacterium]